MTDYPKICFDRILPRDLNRPRRVFALDDPARAIIVIRKMWPNGSTLAVRFMGGTTAQQALAQEEALTWTEHANLTFDFNDAPDAQIRISFDPADGAWSYVGTDCLSIPQSEPTMNLGFQDGGTSVHEFGHAIGFGHEHQSDFNGIQWNEAAVIRDLSGPPNRWTVPQIRHNVLNKYREDQVRGTQFDPDSIMLYAFPAGWTTSGLSTHANAVLSDTDKQFVASELAYPGTDTEPVELPVIDTAGTEAAIGQAGEEDMFTFTATSADRHTIETNGQTDLVMKLFGPDTQTNLIAEDDDGGVGLNSRIVADLTPGQYFVQIRHFNIQQGTGSYSIAVRK